MKKLLLLAVAFFGLQLSAQERDIKAIHNEAREVVNTSTKEIANYLKIEDDKTFQNLRNILFNRVQTQKLNPELTKERLAILDKTMLAELKELLSEKQYQKLMDRKELLDKLTQ